MRDRVLQYIREHSLLGPGDRVAVAVSGGADSVALLRILLEMRAELGIVLLVAHFNHQLRGAESDADEAFVASLAENCGLELYVDRANVQEHARNSKLSTEAAARKLRYQWLASVADQHRIDEVATAHTLDDQAETVLLKLLRGAGTRGLAGIYPVVNLTAGSPKDRLSQASECSSLPGIPVGVPAQSKDSSSTVRVIRPLLGVSREQVEAYLTSISQEWREDETNLDRHFLRNRVRHELLPLLEREYNPKLRQILSDLAEISRGEEEFWEQNLNRELATRQASNGLADEGDRDLNVSSTPGLGLHGFSALPVALQRRVLKRFAEYGGRSLDFEHVERLRQCALGESPSTELPNGQVARLDKQSLVIRPAVPSHKFASYRYVLPVPGAVEIVELRQTVRAELVPEHFAAEAVPGELLNLDLLEAELVVRNWCPGDRFWPAHSRSEEKLKRLFAEKRVPAVERPTWPVVLCGMEIVWVPGFSVANAYRWRGSGDAIRLEAIGAIT